MGNNSKKEKGKYFILYACCIPVKGIQRSIICDLQRNSFIYIPNELYETLCQIPLNENTYKKDRQLSKCLDFLIKNEYGFITTNPDAFPRIDFKKEDFIDIIQNAIIDFDKTSKHDMANVISQLNVLNCSALELRFYDIIDNSTLSSILSAINDSTIRSIHLVIKKTKWTSIKTLSKIVFENKRIAQIIIHSSTINKVIPIDMTTVLIFTKDIVSDETHCGFISPKYFRSNIDFFKESLHKNNCLNKKISIDKKGEIKNCPAMQTAFGNINDVKLNDVLQNVDFTKVWNINKDCIEVCKCCEFRYICQDCRAFSPSDTNCNKPKKCTYDPFATIWS